MGSVPVMPRTGEWTVEDLDRIPDDGLQYELADGLLLVTPTPRLMHQHVCQQLNRALLGAAPEELRVLFAPVDFQPTRRTRLQPDLLVVRAEDLDLEAAALAAPPVLVVEVLSASTRSKDLVLKRARYAESGVPSYWIVDPDEPSVVVLELVGGEYVERGRAVGEESVVVLSPYSLTICPADLVR